ncbi:MULTISPECIES: DUF3592 domain-containing protein [Ruminococcus]|uniref:DUF3592 domain-containing protein n=1 Tax=Ruminococcus albus (strain ATCC 27210 / DSM 20455 / JCM 14654 / NCDO 2250 / 7) TaxID=697329 RepID=E6UF60_RUMA7|nr:MULTISPECIES: DUF3592 domain-containing protein [Ruminococcus]ADU23587.1 hypothetical protein Rumal_3122 [Ruminococcus albus 7 = DSM 20455]MCR5020379.1 DUF3592 domain-containing protein [Ruminococcus sp.]
MNMNVNTSFHVNGTSRNVSSAFVISLVMAIFILIGGIFSTVGIIIGKSIEKTKARCTVPIEAYVISYKYNEDGLTSPVYSYKFEGADYEFSTNSYSNHPPYNVGDNAEIMIDPDSPNKAFVPADKTTAFVATLFKYMGLGFVGVGIIVILVGLFLSHLGKKQEQNDDISKYEQWQ